MRPHARLAHRYRRVALTVAVALALGAASLALPGGAGADAYQTVEQVYASSGNVPPCRFSSRRLEAALSQAPTFDKEYFGDFTAAIQSTLSEQASGVCVRRRAHRASVPLPGPMPASPRPPPSVTSGTGSPIPLPVLLVLGLALAGGLLAAVVAVGRAGGWDPRWAQAARHAWREGEYRLAGAWSQLRDRLGPS
jgi:hypothetical protein